jgi:hypothetical protein
MHRAVLRRHIFLLLLFSAHEPPSEWLSEEALAQHIAAAEQGHVDARSALHRIVTPLNIVKGSKFILDGGTLSHIPAAVKKLTSAIEKADSMLGHIVDLLSELSLLADTAELTATIDTISIEVKAAKIAIRVVHLLYALANEEELFQSKGHCVFAREIWKSQRRSIAHQLANA